MAFHEIPNIEHIETFKHIQTIPESGITFTSEFLHQLQRLKAII